MRYLIFILSLVFSSSAAMAAIVSFSGVDNKNGTATVTWNGTDVIGMALDVTVKSGVISDVSFSGFNVFIDESYDMPFSPAPTPQIFYPGSYSICAGYLSQSGNGLDTGTITFTASQTAVFVLDVNAKRGGVVDRTGPSSVQGLPLTVTATVPEPMLISLTTLGGLFIARRRA